MTAPTTLFQPSAVSVGPGVLWIAAVGSTEPSGVSSSWDDAFTPLGYTDSGHTFTVTNNTSDVEVAETLDPIDVLDTSRTVEVAFSLAEMTARHLQVAFAGGEITTAGGTVKFDPPVLGDRTPVMLGWDSTDHTERVLWRKCVPSGAIAIPRQKAPDKAVIPITFRALTPDDATKQPWTYYGADGIR
jgi:hypothetical protein